MQNKNSRRAAIAIGVIMIASMVAAPIMGLLQQVTSSANTAAETPATTPTVLPPTPDVNALIFDNSYLHPTALFSVDYPTGWVPGSPSQSTAQARIAFSNATAQNDIDVMVEVPDPKITTVAEVNGRYPTNVVQSSLSQYGTAVETARREEGDQLIVDFEINRSGQNRLARQVSWTDGDWIYSVRVIAPTNARESLLYLLQQTIANIQPHKEFNTVPVSWNAYFDPQDKSIIRYPNSWAVTDSAPGLPASISSANGSINLRVETQDAQVSSENDVTAWLKTFRSDVELLNAQPVDRDGSSGFSAAYGYHNVDGEAVSGYVVLLNGGDGKLHVANLHWLADGVDLNNLTDETSAYQGFADAMATFTIAPELTPTTAAAS